MTELSFTSKKENKKMKNIEVNKPNFWTEEEDRILKEKAEEFNYKNWNSIANFIPGRTSIQCSARYRRIRPGLVKGAWDKEEDNKLLSLYEKYGKNWAAISKEMPHRTGKQIRDRFLNSLDSKFERGKFTEEEDQIIIKYYKIYGNSWAKIAKKLKTRTGDMVKNRFYSSLKKTIFKSKSFLKRKRERTIAQKNKNKIEEEYISEINKKAKLSEQNSPTTKEIKKKKEPKEPKEKKNEAKKIEKKEQKNQLIQKDSNDQEFETLKIEDSEQNEQKDKKEIINFLNIKDSIQENDEINNQKNKMNNNMSSTNNISYDSNNNSIDMENKNNNQIKNNSSNPSFDFNEHISSKQFINNSDNVNKNEANNNIDFNLEENIKKPEIQNAPELNENYRIYSEFFIDINDNINNNLVSLYQKDEIEERLEKLKNVPKAELEYKQNLKEKLDIIYDLENIINQKLISIQKEIENN